MIRWCSYCQAYIGEEAPLDDFSVKYDICNGCITRLGEGNRLKINPALRDFYSEIFEKVSSGQQVSPEHILARAKSMNMNTYEMMIGVLHPLLWKIGKCFEQRLISVAKEQLFSQSVNQLLEQLSISGGSKKEKVLFIVARDNEHLFGVQFFQHLMYHKYGIGCKVIKKPPLTEDAFKALLKASMPEIIGVSVALPEHIDYALELDQWLGENSDVKLLIGGAASRLARDYKQLRESAYIADPYDILDSAEEIARMCSRGTVTGTDKMITE